MRKLLERSGCWISALGILVVACAPSAQPAAPVPAKPAAPAAPAAAPAPAKPAEPKAVAEKPRRGGTWRVGGEQLAPPPALDHGRRLQAANLNLISAVSCKLVMWDERPDRIPGAQEQVLSDLAEKWEISGNGTIYTFHLRKGVILPPPSNREVVADDIIRAFYRNSGLLPGGGLPFNVPAMFALDSNGNMDNKKPQVKALDKYTVQITLREPDADFLSVTGGHWWAIDFDKDFYEPTDDGWGEIKKAEHFKGCGPFMMKEYVIGSHTTFVRNPNYYNKELPYLDVVENRFMFDPAVATAALRGNQLDSWGIMVTMPLSLSKELENAPNLEVKYLPGGWYWPWQFDLANPPFNDVRVRRALALSIERKSWIRDLYFGHGQSVVLIEPFLEFWNLPPEKMGDDGKYYTTYDPEAAKKLLKEAGYPNGFTFEVLTSNAAAHVVSYPMIELAQSYFDAIGVKMKINVMDYGAWAIAPMAQGAVFQSGIARPDISSFVHGMIHPATALKAGKSMYEGLTERDPTYKKAVEIMEKQRRTMDIQERLKLVYQLQRTWAQNLWTFYYPVPDSTLVNNKKVRGYNPIAGWNAGNWKYVWMAE